MKNRVNDNDNVIGFPKTTISMNNDNDIDSRFAKSKRVEMIADKLVHIYNNPGFRPYYCKVAWKLSEAKIWTNVEAAKQGDAPAKLFSYLCRRDGV